MTFEEIAKQVGNNTILSPQKAKVLYAQLIMTKDVLGAMAEVGVYKGGTAKIMRLAMPGKVLHLYDTFTGVVASNPTIDVHKDGEFGDTDAAKVLALVGCDETSYHIGMFPDTFNESGPFSFVHSDTDTYFGTKESLAKFAPLLSVGGKMILDDYEWANCPGVKKAVVEWLMMNTLPFDGEIFPNQYILTRL